MSLATLHAPQRSSDWLGLRDILAECRRRQPLFFAMAVVMLALIPPTAAAYFFDDRLVNGINVWSKPLKFEVSLTPFFATLAWFWGYLPEERREGRGLNAYAAVTAALVFLEVAWMIVQSGRGVGAHFNEATLVEGIVFSLAGVAALIFTTFPLVLGIALARSGDSHLAPAFRLSVILGLVLTFFLGGAAGVALAANHGHWVAAAPTDAGGFPIFGWTRSGGDLRVAHFFGIHAMQILPIAGWLIALRRPNASGLVWLAAAGLVGLTAFTLVQALAGEPFLAFIG